MGKDYIQSSFLRRMFEKKESNTNIASR